MIYFMMVEITIENPFCVWKRSWKREDSATQRMEVSVEAVGQGLGCHKTESAASWFADGGE
jgi:hypothetical protein